MLKAVTMSPSPAFTADFDDFGDAGQPKGVISELLA
jgi:hypothetical protein